MQLRFSMMSAERQDAWIHPSGLERGTVSVVVFQRELACRLAPSRCRRNGWRRESQMNLSILETVTLPEIQHKLSLSFQGFLSFRVEGTSPREGDSSVSDPVPGSHNL